MDIMAILEAIHQKNMQMKDAGYGNLKGLENMVKTSSDTPKNMAMGGEVPEEIDQWFNQPMQPAPALSDVMTTINKTPPTDYSFFKNMSAEERAKVAQMIQQKQHSGGNLIASGLGGLGDAISNSFGGKNTSFQKDIEAGAQKSADQELTNYDAQRTMKMQDFDADEKMRMQDPNHPRAVAMREFMKSQGINAPSGMNVDMMMKVLGPMGEIALKQATLAENQRHNQEMEGLQDRTIKNTDEARKIASAEKEADNKRMATEALGKQGFISRAFHPEIAKSLEEQAGLNQPVQPLAFDKDKEARYQAWKASQGR